MKRRDFLKVGAAGVSALCVGDCVPWFMQGEAVAATKTLNFVITDAEKEMGTFNSLSDAVLPAQIPPVKAGRCYFWVYRDNGPNPVPPDCPGPHIFVTTGDTINITITNALDEPHNFFIPGVATNPARPPRPIFNSGVIAPGATVTRRFRAPTPGTYMYFDSLNAPVNRVMGLHGALISMPRAPRALPAGRAPARRVTPYGRPTPAIQRLFNDLGSLPAGVARPRVGSAWWPGLSWEQGDPATNTPAFRQYIWLIHQASPTLFAKVGDFTPGQDYPAAQFVNEFLFDQLDPLNPVQQTNFTPQYFTINGQSGHFAHNTPYINPNNRVGEPVLIRILNAGLWCHSMHIHANHAYVSFINETLQTVPSVTPGAPPVPVGVVDEGRQNGVQTNPLWVDVFTVNPLGIYDWVLPYQRPPDVPNVRGVGRADAGLPTLAGTTWPPTEELALVIPQGATAGATPIDVQLAPMCYPMHDHSEPSQTSEGGNYNMGMIAGMNFIGDRTLPGGVQNFGHQPVKFPPGPDGVFPMSVEPPWFE
ncbi:MAG: multicopper oxidase domain-containing protein [Syntrophobacteraceae bacterium]